MQKKICSLISWNLLITYLNKKSKEGFHAYSRIGNVFNFEENSDKRYYYFLEKSYISIFETNKESLKNESTEELEIMQDDIKFHVSSLPHIFRNEITDKSCDLVKRKYNNLNSFEIYLFILVVLVLLVMNYVIEIKIAPIWLLSFIVTFLIQAVIHICLKIIYRNK